MNFERYIGIPWRAGGRGMAGADCWGLVWLFYRNELAIEIPDYRDAYDLSCDAGELGNLITEKLTGWVEVGKPEPGSVALLNRTGQPCHVGIVAPGRRLLHVESAEAPSCLVPLTDSLRRRLVGYFVPKGLS